MKILDKLALKVFSILVLVIAIGMILMITGILPYDLIEQYLKLLTDYENGVKITIGVLAVLILLAVKGFFFTSKQTDNSKDGIVLENTSGKLVISKESLENLIASVIKDIPGTIPQKLVSYFPNQFKRHHGPKSADYNRQTPIKDFPHVILLHIPHP